MCADLLNLESEIRTLESLGVDMLHIDVMDAHFVPNLAIGYGLIKALQKCTSLPLDCHFMVTDPELALERLGSLRPGDGFTAHAGLLDDSGHPRSYRAWHGRLLWGGPQSGHTAGSP